MIGRPSAATTASFALSNDVDLEDTPDRMRAMGRAAVERSITHIAAMPNDSRPGNFDAAALCLSRVARGSPGARQRLRGSHDRLFGELIPCSCSTSRSGYLAYVASGGAYLAALAGVDAHHMAMAAVNRVE